jgi:hypothetical protein
VNHQCSAAGGREFGAVQRLHRINIFVTGLTPALFNFYSRGRIGVTGPIGPDADTPTEPDVPWTPVFFLCSQPIRYCAPHATRRQKLGLVISVVFKLSDDLSVLGADFTLKLVV